MKVALVIGTRPQIIKSASQSLNMLATAIRQLSATRSLSQPLQLIAETARQWTSINLPSQTLLVKTLTQSTAGVYRALQQSLSVLVDVTRQRISIREFSQGISFTADIIKSFTKSIPPPPPFFPPMFKSYMRSVTQRLSMQGTVRGIQAIFKAVGENVITTMRILTKACVRASVVLEFLVKSTSSFMHTPRIIIPPLRMGNAWITMMGLLLGVILTILYIVYNKRERILEPFL